MDVGMSGGVLNALPQVHMHCQANLALLPSLQSCSVCVALTIMNIFFGKIALLNIFWLQILEIHEVNGETMVKVVTAAAPCTLNRQQGAKNAF